MIVHVAFHSVAMMLGIVERRTGMNCSAIRYPYFYCNVHVHVYNNGSTYIHVLLQYMYNVYTRVRNVNMEGASLRFAVY